MAQTKIKAGGFDADVITGTTALAATPADTDEFVISDAGTLKRIDYAELRSSFGNVAFSARLDSNTTLNDATDTDIVFGTEILDTDSAYDNSNGIFTAPVTAKYLIGTTLMFADAEGNNSDARAKLDINGTAQEIIRCENTSNGTITTKHTLNYMTILPAVTATHTLKIIAYQDTNNSSSSLLQGAGYTGTFWGISLID
jgi:hypothetical protein